MAKTKTTIDTTGAAGTYLGTLYGASGAMQLVLADGARASEWPGWDGAEDGRNRNLLIDWEDDEAGTMCDAGSAGAVSVWTIEGGIALLDFFPADDFDDRSKRGGRELALRVAQLPAKGRPLSRGFVHVQSSCIAIMLEYADVDRVAAMRKKAAHAKQLAEFHDHGVLAALENGRYEVVVERLDHDDVSGHYETRTRIVRAAAPRTIVAKPKAAARPKKIEIEYAGPRAQPWGWIAWREPFDFIALDADDAPRYDGDADFERAFAIVSRKKAGWGPMTTKAGAQILVGQLGAGLAISFWKLSGGLGLLDLDHDPSAMDLRSKTGKELLGAHFAQLPAVRSDRIGTVTVRSGALCVLRTIAHPKAPPRPSGDKPKIVASRGVELGAAFPVANGTYDVIRDVLGDERKGLATDIGRLHVRVRILRSGAAKKETRAAKHAPAKKRSAVSKPAPSRKGRVHLEMSEGTSSKFWEAWVEGSTLMVRFGRIGTDGQTKPKPFASASAALTERDALAASKRKKGYA